MELKNWILLIVLAAIWGSAFMFIKISTEDFGPNLLVALRLLLAGIIFTPFLLQKKNRIYFKSYLPGILILAIFNNALPFTMFSYASLGATSNMLAILNGATALITMVIAFFWLKEAISFKQFLGLILGFIGIIILVNPLNSSTTIMASFAALIGASCYAFGANYIQKHHLDSNKFVLVGWAMLFGGLLMIPLAITNLPDHLPSTKSILSLLWLSIIATGMAYLVFVKLIENIGAVRTSTVTYLIPVFGILWGYIFLNELITWIILGGFIFIMIGIYLANSNFQTTVEK